MLTRADTWCPGGGLVRDGVAAGHDLQRDDAAARPRHRAAARRHHLPGVHQSARRGLEEEGRVLIVTGLEFYSRYVILMRRVILNQVFEYVLLCMDK